MDDGNVTMSLMRSIRSFGAVVLFCCARTPKLGLSIQIPFKIFVTIQGGQEHIVF